jgi:hypothetical protein
MSTTIQCSHCLRLLRLREEDMGRVVRCPCCNQTFAAHVKSEPAAPPMALADFERPSVHPSASAAAPSEPKLRTPSPPEPEGGTYAVELDAEALLPPSPRSRRPQRRPRPPRSDSFDDEEDTDVLPHRGVLILVLGILSLVLACIPLAGWLLGGFAMSMASHDERRMEENVMDRSGWGLTRGGQICGILGVFLATVIFILNMVLLARGLR